TVETLMFASSSDLTHHESHSSYTVLFVDVCTGSSISSLTLDDDGSRWWYDTPWPCDPSVAVDAVSGTSYWVALSTPGAAEPPNGQIVLEYGVKPSNDDFGAAQATGGASGTVAGRTLG